VKVLWGGQDGASQPGVDIYTKESRGEDRYKKRNPSSDSLVKWWLGRRAKESSGNGTLSGVHWLTQLFRGRDKSPGGGGHLQQKAHSVAPKILDGKGGTCGSPKDLRNLEDPHNPSCTSQRKGKKESK